MQQLGIGENARERIVDLMGEHGSHLADRRHLFRMQGVLVSTFQFARLLFHALLQSSCPRNVFGMFRFELIAHGVEGVRQFSNFIFRLYVNLMPKIPRREPLSALFESLYRTPYNLPNEEPAQQRD